MGEKEVTNELKAIYQKGYTDGFTDACTLMRESTMALIESMNESLANSESTGNVLRKKQA